MSDLTPEEKKPEDETPEVEQPESVEEQPEEIEVVSEEEVVVEEVSDEEPAEELHVEEEPEVEAMYVEAEVVEPEGHPQQLPPPSPVGTAMATTSEERTWSLIAHLSILLNLFTAVLGPLVALVIYFVFRDRSKYIAYQSFQSFLFQLIFWVGAGFLIGIMWALTGILSIVLIGLCLIPIACVISLVPLVALGYGIVGAIKTGQGEDFRYWLVGDWTRDILEN